MANKRVVELAEINDISCEVQQRRWNWLGHILRREGENDCFKALGWTPKGQRARGTTTTTTTIPLFALYSITYIKERKKIYIYLYLMTPGAGIILRFSRPKTTWRRTVEKERNKAGWKS